MKASLRTTAIQVVTPLVILLGSFPGASFGAIATGYSIESLTLSSSSIAVYQVNEVSNTATEHDGWMHSRINAKRISELKGETPKDYVIEFNYSQKYDFPPVRKGSTILVFDPEIQWPYKVRLDGTKGGDSEWRPAITSDLRVFSNADSIINLVKSTLDIKKGGDKSPCNLVQVTEWAPDSTEAFRELNSMSAVIMHTIMQPRHRTLLLYIAEHDTGLPRAQAVQVLNQCFPETNTRPILEKMLTDSGKQEFWTGDTLYPARQFAYEELKNNGVAANIPVGYRGEYTGVFTLRAINSLSFDSFESSLTTSSWPECYRPLKDQPAAFEYPDFEYPDSFLALGVEGKVHLSLEVARDGEVDDVKVASIEIEAPPNGVADALLKSAQLWKFKPVTVHGVPRRTTIVVPLRTEGPSGPLVLSKERSPYFVKEGRRYDESPRVLDMGSQPWGWKLATGGTCEIEASIDSSGQVREAKMIGSKGVVVEENLSGTSTPFEEEYLNAVRLWKFSPGKIHGVSVPAVIRIPLEVPRTHLVADAVGFYRFFPGVHENPDEPLALLESPLPTDIHAWPNWDFSMVLKIDETGKVDEVYLPSRKLMRPLVEQMLAKAKKFRFVSADEKDPEICVVNMSQDFQLPSYLFGVGLFRK